MRTEEPDSEPQAHRGVFATTHWGMVLAAGEKNTAESAAALEELCRTYWYPLYAYVRRRGHCPEDSQDLTQEFFYQFLRGNYLTHVDPRKGKFRSFLLAGINHFLAKEWHRSRRLKRGGGATLLAFDESRAEERYQGERLGGRSPEEIYERTWAIALLDRVLRRLADESFAAGQGPRFEELKPVLMGERPSLSYADLALRLGTTEPALKMTVQRLRRRYAELVQEEIAQTVRAPQEVEDELRHLRRVLGAGA